MISDHALAQDYPTNGLSSAAPQGFVTTLLGIACAARFTSVNTDAVCTDS